MIVSRPSFLLGSAVDLGIEVFRTDDASGRELDGAGRNAVRIAAMVRCRAADTSRRKKE